MAVDYTLLDDAYEEAARAFGVDPDILRGIGYAESNFNPDAVGPVTKSGERAVGMMQFMPSTAKEFGVDPTDPYASVFGAAAHLRRDLDRFNGDYQRAIAAYNWGPNREAFSREDWHTAIPKETYDYVGRVLGFAAGQDENIARMPIKPRLRPMEPVATEEPQQPVEATPRPTAPVEEPLPEASFLRRAADVGVSALQIGPEAVKGVAQLGRLATGDQWEFAKDVEAAMERGTKAIQEVLGSDRYNAQQKQFAQVMGDPNKGLGDMFSYLIDNPAVLIDKSITTLGSMFLPAGVAGTVGKTAKAFGAAAPLVSKAVTAASIGTTMAQNAASTYSDLADLPEEERYKAAAISAAATALMGIATKGGAEGEIARRMAADVSAGKVSLESAKGFIRKAVESGAREGIQEAGEEVGDVAGKAVATGELPEPTQAAKQIGLAGTLGAVVGGGANVAADMVPVTRAEAQARKAVETEAETAPEARQAPSEGVQLYDEQYFPVDEQGRRIVEEAEAKAQATPEGVAEPVVRRRGEVSAQPTVGPEVAQEVATEDVDRTKPAEEIIIGMPDIRRLAQQNGYGKWATSKTAGEWLENNIAGKSLTEIKALVDANPALVKGNGSRATLLSQLIADVPIAPTTTAPDTETTRAETTETALPVTEEVSEVPTERGGDGTRVEGTIQPETGVVATGESAAPASTRVGDVERVVDTTDAGTQAEPTAVTPTAEPDPELARLKPILPEAAIDTDLRDARENWEANISQRMDEARARWEADTEVETGKKPAEGAWEKLSAEKRAERAKVVNWDALPDERKAEWVQATIDRYSQPQADTYYAKRFNQISDEVMREPAKPLPPAKTREQNLTYSSLAKAQEASAKFEERITALQQERKALATENEKGQTVPPKDGTEEGLRYDKLTSQITELENRKSIADRDLDIYGLKLQQEVGESPKPLPPAQEVYGKEVEGPNTKDTIARNNAQRAYDRGEIDVAALSKLNGMIKAGKSQQVVQMLNKLRAIRAEPGTTGVGSDITAGRRTGYKAVDSVRDLFSEIGEGVPMPKAAHEAVEAGNASAAMEVLGREGTNDVVRETAAKIAPLLANTRAEFVEDLRNAEGREAAGAAAVDGSYVRLDRNRGVDEETLVHEGVHAASERVLAAPDAELTEPQRSGKRELNAVWEAVRSDNSVPLTDAARANVSEFASESMSRKAVQDALRAKTAPESRGNLWQRFKRAVMRMVGMHQPKNMRDAVVDAMDKVFTAVPEAEVKTAEKTKPESKAELSSLAPQTKAAIKNLPGPKRRAAQQFVPAASDALSDLSFGEWLGGWVDRNIRTRSSDRMATLAMRLARVEGAAVRDTMGRVNPLLQMRQAADVDKLLRDFFSDGKLEFDKNTRQFYVDKAATAPADVPEAIKKWAENNGMSFDEAYDEYLPKIYEAVRLYNTEESAKASGEKSGTIPHLPKEFIAQAMKEYNADPELQRITELMDAPRIELIQLGVRTGRWSAEEAAELSKVIGYVPFDRLIDPENQRGTKKRTKAGITSFTNIPELVGTTEYEVKNVFDNYFNTLAFLASEAIRNSAAISTLKYMEEHGLAVDLGQTPSAARVPANTVSAFIDGERRFYEVPSRFDVMAFKHEPALLTGTVENLAKVSRFFRKTITMYPLFSGKQLADDIQRAVVTTGVKDAAAVAAMATSRYASLLKSESLGQRDPLVQKFGRKGLTGEIDWERANPASSYLKDTGYKKRGFGDPISRAVAALGHRLDGIAHASDLAVRSAVYDQILKETGDDARAIAAARELINFRRQGSSKSLSSWLVPLTPFLNAKIQGIDILYRGLTGRDAPSGMARADAVKMLAYRGMQFMALSALYALAKAGDDDYDKNIDLQKRDKMWVLGGGVGISVPTELGVIFKLIPEYTVEYLRRKGTPEEQAASEAAITWLTRAFETYVGDPAAAVVPHPLRPLLENYLNKSFFTKRPLEGKYLENVDPSERTVASTSETAKMVSKFAKDTVGYEVSPIKVDNFFRGYLGSMGAAFNMVLDAMLNPDRLDRPLHRFAGLGGFTYDTEGSARTKDEFYKLREDADRARNTLGLIGTQGDYEKYQRYEREMWPLLQVYGMTTNTLNQLSIIRRDINYLQGNKESIEAYVKAAKDKGAANPREEAKRMREADISKLRTTEKELLGWVRQAQTEVNKQRALLKKKGIELD